MADGVARTPDAEARADEAARPPVRADLADGEGRVRVAPAREVPERTAPGSVALGLAGLGSAALRQVGAARRARACSRPSVCASRRLRGPKTSNCAAATLCT